MRIADGLMAFHDADDVDRAERDAEGASEQARIFSIARKLAAGDFVPADDEVCQISPRFSDGWPVWRRVAISKRFWVILDGYVLLFSRLTVRVLLRSYVDGCCALRRNQIRGDF